MRHSLNIIYAEQCPFCSAYMRPARLQEQADVTLTNAREVPALVAKLAREGIDLDIGMVVVLDGALSRRSGHARAGVADHVCWHPEAYERLAVRLHAPGTYRLSMAAPWPQRHPWLNALD